MGLGVYERRVEATGDLNMLVGSNFLFLLLLNIAQELALWSLSFDIIL